MRRLITPFILGSLLLLPTAAQAKADNRVEQVRLDHKDGNLVVTINTTSPPIFQSYARKRPAILIVDLIDTAAKSQDLKSSLKSIESISLRQKEGSGGTISRLTIRADAPMEYDVTAEGKQVMLRLSTGKSLPQFVEPVVSAALPTGTITKKTKSKKVAALGKATPRASTQTRLAQADDLDDDDLDEDDDDDLDVDDDGDDLDGPVTNGSAGMSTSSGPVSSGTNAMTYIGFKNSSSDSQIFVRMTKPGNAQITRQGDNLLVLEIVDARIPLRNNKHHLDTTYFKSPVKMITPTEVETGAGRIRINVEMKENVPYSTRTDGNTIYVVFQK